jgi:hypothetical protein
MWKLLVFAVASLGAVPAFGQTVFYECSMSDPSSESQQREVTYDVGTGSLSWDSVEGGNGQMVAVANGEVITATSDMAPDLRDVFTINRSTGAATSALQIDGKASQPSVGTCKQVAELPKFPHEQFTAAEYEFAAHFIALIQANRLDAAKQMLASNADVRSWTDDEGVRRTLNEFSSYIRQCPVGQFEGVNTRAAHNINVNLDCPGNGGASMEFNRGKISSIRYGGPPPLIRTVTAPQQ